jgi:hypothetical protein
VGTINPITNPNTVYSNTPHIHVKILYIFVIYLYISHVVQNGSEAHPASYPMDTRDDFLGDKADGA